MSARTTDGSLAPDFAETQEGESTVTLSDAEVESLWLNDRLLAERVRTLEKMLDTKASPWWKRLWWRLDGWPAWYEVGPRSWRPWHRGD